MMSDEKTCLGCTNLMGCVFLADDIGKFVPERVITSQSQDHCKGWEPVGARQEAIRQTLVGIQGVGALRVLHQVPALVMEHVIEQEKADEMMEMEEAPDFGGMVYEGMTNVDREEQLRYETDEDGNFIEEDGRRRPRPSYQLRRFACDPEGHIQLDHSVGMFWTNDQVIKHIVSAEVEQGLLTKVKKTRKKNPEKPAADEAASDGETKMATGRRVMINRGAKDSGKKGGGKVSSPPAKSGAKKASSKSNGAADPAPVEGFDTKGFLEDLEVAIGQIVTKIVDEKVNEAVSQVNARFDEQDDLNNKVTSVFHDLMVQTGGTMNAYTDEEGNEQQIGEIYNEEGRFLAYVPADEGEG
jgi:hypothetical protein